MKQEAEERLGKQQLQSRWLTIDRESVVEEERTAEFSVSSEYPVEGWFEVETLDHSEGAIRLERFNNGASLRDDHSGDQIGVVLKGWIDSATRKLRCKLRFSKGARGTEIWQDVMDGIRKNVSIRYVVHRWVLEKKEGDKEYRRVLDWEPIHVAITPDPADPTVGVGRSFQIDEAENKTENKNKQGERAMGAETGNVQEPVVDNSAVIAQAVREAMTKEQNRSVSISALAEDFSHLVKHIDLKQRAMEYQREGKSSEDFFAMIRSEMKKPEAKGVSTAEAGLSEKETNSYSLRNIILYQLGKLDRDKVGLELEAHRALLKNGEKATNANGMLIPTEILNRRRNIRVNNLSSRERDLVVGTPASGGYLVRDEYISYSFIELLQNAMITGALGADVITGLTGDIPMNRELDNYQYYHVGEGAGPIKSEITFAQEKMTPKKGGVLAKYSYEFLRQGQPGNMSVEAYVEKKLAIACALGADRDALYGSGNSYQPKGLKLWTGIGGVNGAGFDRLKALTMEGQLYTGNAASLGTQKWAGRGSLRSLLKGKLVDAGSAQFLCSDKNEMIGYDFSNVSNQVDSGDLFFGIWNQLLIGFWNAFEIVANPYGDEEFAAGDVKVRALQSLDVFVLNPAAFSLATGVN